MALYPPEPDIPSGEKMCLLLLRRNDLAGKIVEHLHQWGWPEPTKEDWRNQIAANHIHRKDGRLQLTPSGLWTTTQICTDLARKIPVHVATYSKGRYGRKVSCSCGSWSTSARNQNYSSDIALMRHFGDHLVKVGAVAPPLITEVAAKVEEVRPS